MSELPSDAIEECINEFYDELLGVWGTQKFKEAALNQLQALHHEIVRLQIMVDEFEPAWKLQQGDTQ